MTRARKELIAVDETPFYHCIARCVRRSYLCGEDYSTGNNYDHRKGWLVVERFKYLASLFALDVSPQANLKPLDGSAHTPLSQGRMFTHRDYIELVDWSGRLVREGKGGAIDGELPSIVKRLGLEEESWIESVKNFSQHFYLAVGSEAELVRFEAARRRVLKPGEGGKTLQWDGAMQRRNIKGISAARRFFWVMTV